MAAPTPDPQPDFLMLLSCFSEVTQQDTITGMGSSTCALDTFPTALVMAKISAISPLITIIINYSLQAGHVL